MKIHPLSALLLPVLLSLGSCSTTTAIDESLELSRRGQHHRAYDLLNAERNRAMRAGEAVDPALVKVWLDARLIHLLENGRRFIFLELDDEALVALAGVLAIDPGHVEAKRLRERAIYKKAERTTIRGQRLLAKHQLKEALVEFVEAERILPSFTDALRGQQDVRDQFDLLTARAQIQFLDAVRKLPEFRYIEVRWHSSNALVNDPLRDDADEIRRIAQREIAFATMERGRECQRRDQFGAALVEFKLAKDLDKMLPDIDAAIADMERELEASNMAQQAQMHMRRLEFAAAKDVLEKAYEMSAMLRGEISELMIQNRRMEGDRDYGVAHDFEIQGLKQEALERYVALSANWENGLNDEKARIEALQADITAAKAEWKLATEAEQAGELAVALEHFIASENLYSKLADAKERIARLRAKLAAANENGGSGS